MEFFVYSIVVAWFHRAGHASVRFPLRPWSRRKYEPSFADMLTTLRRVSYAEKAAPLLSVRSGLKAWIGRLAELLGRASS